MLRSLTKLSIPHTRMANTMPNAIAATMSMVLTPRTIPTSMLLSSTSLTKLMIGTPGTINNVQAISGCQGVVVCSAWASHWGMSATNCELANVPNSHAMMVATKAAMAMLA